MPKVVVRGTLTVPSNDLEAVLKVLPEHIRATQAEPGCIEFRVSPREEGKGVFEVYEEFTDSEAFEAHQARIRSSNWASVSANAIRDYQVSELDNK